jgi:hypothetical protein
MLRMLWRDAHSNYAPTADTCGLIKTTHRRFIGYGSLQALFDGEAAGGAKASIAWGIGQASHRAPRIRIDRPSRWTVRISQPEAVRKIAVKPFGTLEQRSESFRLRRPLSF